MDNALYSIFDYFANAHSSAPQVVKWTQPYDDAMGTGLMVTATLNCYVDGVFVGIMADSEDREMMTEDKLISLIEVSLKRTFSPESLAPRYKDEREISQMFRRNLTAFTNYLEIELAPKIEHLQDIFYKYKFDSPLNFIMIKSDFKMFFESFT